MQDSWTCRTRRNHRVPCAHSRGTHSPSNKSSSVFYSLKTAASFQSRRIALVVYAFKTHHQIWQLGSQETLATFCFPHPLTCIAVDPSETMFYVGTVAGTLHVAHLYPQSQPGVFTGLVPGSVVENDSMETGFVGHTGAIQSLSLSMDGSRLVSGSQDGSVIVWDTRSRQSLRTFDHHKGIFEKRSQKGPVTSVWVMLSPPFLFNPWDKIPTKMAQLQRYPKTRAQMHALPMTPRRGSQQVRTLSSYYRFYLNCIILDFFSEF